MRVDLRPLGEGLAEAEPDVLRDRDNHFQGGEDHFHDEVGFLRGGPPLLRFRDELLSVRNNLPRAQENLIRHRVTVAVGIGAGDAIAAGGIDQHKGWRP